MHIADTLSRAHPIENDSEEIELGVYILTKHLPMPETRKAEFLSATELDSSLQQVRKLTMEGWSTEINNYLIQHESTGRYVTNYK